MRKSWPGEREALLGGIPFIYPAIRPCIWQMFMESVLGWEIRHGAVNEADRVLSSGNRQWWRTWPSRPSSVGARVTVCEASVPRAQRRHADC